MQIDLSLPQFYESLNILEGVFAPLEGFMSSSDLESVTSSLQLTNGAIFPVPVTLDISEDMARSLKGEKSVNLYFENKKLCSLEISEIYKPNKEKISQHCFGTTDLEHPGVLYLKNTSEYCIAGRLISDTLLPKKDNYFTPSQTKAFFKEKGWKTIAGFQTRNVPHKAHEYLHRLALEMVDGLMIQPLVGWKKPGDYTQDAIYSSYQIIMNDFYPKNSVFFNFLYTHMRYAGPREALFHAIIRRNFGCTHFIVGRDHAGVKDYYGVYDAQKLSLDYEERLKIKILPFKEPYYCKKCNSIVTEKHCNHSEDPHYRQNISGTMIRKMLQNEEKIDSRYLRQEILDVLKNIPLFV